MRNLIASLSCWSGYPIWNRSGQSERKGLRRVIAQFIWDDDFRDQVTTDIPPEQADAIKSMMSISDEYFSSAPPDLEIDYCPRGRYRRIKILADRKKTVRFTATLEISIPASLTIDEIEGEKTILGCFPTVTNMRDEGDGNATEAGDSLLDLFMEGVTLNSDIEIIDGPAAGQR